jgi:hypothetical protein
VFSAKMVAKNRFYKSSIGELHRGCFVGVIHCRNHVTAAGKIFNKIRVIGESTCVAMCEDYYRMWAVRDGGAFMQLFALTSGNAKPTRSDWARPPFGWYSKPSVPLS